MLKSHEKFYSKNGRRLVLAAIDDPQDRHFFDEILKDEYVLMFAPDKEEAKKMIWESADVLSLVITHFRSSEESMEILDLVLQEPELKHIPVIIADEDQMLESRAISGGAIDFFPVPYPMPEIIKVRIRRTIELCEDRFIISLTERDHLTGLYNREFFHQYAKAYDHHHKTREMDAIVIDVNNFRTINERFGAAYGDEILRRIGERVREMVKDSGGIVCRREADTFQVYCPHRDNYEAILDNASIGLTEDGSVSDRVRLRMGVYSNVDKNMAIDRRFDRANMACNSVRGQFAKAIGMYDSSLHEKELEDARLVEEFHAAIQTRQFQVYYQPKFDVRGEKPLLTSAEALVRWIHPQKGIISPGHFIPLFENNGLIQPLDHYVWEEAARQIRDWKQELGFSVPVSVNVSRVNMYDPNMVGFLMSIVKEYGLNPSEIYLEVTESAYTKDSDQIIRKVELLRDLGFRIEMDDFGTGYSSLNMISRLPIDALKLDREFIQTAFRGSRNTRMLEIMLDIGDYLDVPVVAEGVETEEEMLELKKMGCQVIQGYYFSKPVPARDFESFLIARRSEGEGVSIFNSIGQKADRQRLENSDSMRLSDIAATMFHGFSKIFEVDPVTEKYTEYTVSEDGKSLHLEKESVHFFDFNRRSLIHYMHPDDQRVFLDMFSKDRAMDALAKNKTIASVFRLMFNGEPTFICVRAAAGDETVGRKIIIGISTVDVQIMQDERYYQSVRSIHKDSLTGTKNMNAYLQAERQINESIQGGEAEPFAIAVVSLDGYREIRSREGQKQANQEVREVCSIVCDVFDHSPVYRIGDDEFIAILMRRDYQNRKELREKLRQIRDEKRAAGETDYSFGMADYLPEQDKRLSSVFERANTVLYSSKLEPVKTEETEATS